MDVDTRLAPPRHVHLVAFLVHVQNRGEDGDVRRPRLGRRTLARKRVVRPPLDSKGQSLKSGII